MIAATTTQEYSDDERDSAGDQFYGMTTFDSNNDNYEESFAADTNQNGVFDAYMSDTDGDGQYDVEMFDVNQDGFMEHNVVDQNSDGMFDTYVADRDGDLVLETIVVDVDQDGVDDRAVQIATPIVGGPNNAPLIPTDGFVGPVTNPDPLYSLVLDLAEKTGQPVYGPSDRDGDMYNDNEDARPGDPYYH